MSEYAKAKNAVDQVVDRLNGQLKLIRQGEQPPAELLPELKKARSAIDELIAAIEKKQY